MLSAADRRAKRNWFIFLIGYFAAGYLSLNHINLNRTFFWDVGFAFESDIPFVPAAIFGYLLVYLSIVLLYLLIDDIGDFHRAVVAMLLVSTVHFILFALIPVRMDLRPDLGSASGFAAAATRVYYMIDQPTNCFPSLHVAYPTLAACLLWRQRPRWRIPFVAMTATIAISVVLVKQHYIADVVAGAIAALALYWVTRRTERIWKRWF